jgi:ABC-type lipoprotein export system ATPase subunit
MRIKKNYTLKDINLEIKLNSSTGIFGKSGSGKTTLLDIISGLIVPNEGIF